MMPSRNNWYTISWDISWLVCIYFFFLCTLVHAILHLEDSLIFAWIFMTQPRLCLFWKLPLAASSGLPLLNSETDYNLHNYLINLIMGQSCDITCHCLHFKLFVVVTFHIFILSFQFWLCFLKVGIRSCIPLYPYLSEVKGKVLVTHLCPTLYDPMDCSPPGSSVHGILQARILEWVAIPFSRRSPQPRDWT